MENALFEFFYSTGCRIGEVVKLNRSVIIFITNSVIVHGKGDKEREVYFNTRCSLWLKRYLDSRDDTDPCLFITDRKPRRSHKGKRYWKINKIETGRKMR